MCDIKVKSLKIDGLIFLNFRLSMQYVNIRYSDTGLDESYAYGRLNPAKFGVLELG